MYLVSLSERGYIANGIQHNVGLLCQPILNLKKFEFGVWVEKYVKLKHISQRENVEKRSDIAYMFTILRQNVCCWILDYLMPVVVPDTCCYLVIFTAFLNKILPVVCYFVIVKSRF